MPVPTPAATCEGGEPGRMGAGASRRLGRNKARARRAVITGQRMGLVRPTDAQPKRRAHAARPAAQ